MELYNSSVDQKISKNKKKVLEMKHFIKEKTIEYEKKLDFKESINVFIQ